MTTVSVLVDGLEVAVEMLPDGTFVRPAYLTEALPSIVSTKHVRDIRRQPGRPVGWGMQAANRDKDEYIDHPITEPTVDSARKWWGWGTNLKPAHEPIVLARKPLIGSVARNVLLHGTGALNIDATRIPLQQGEEYTINTFDDGAKPFGGGAGHPYTSRKVAAGREGEASAEKRYDEEGSTDFAMTPGPRGGDAKGRWPSNILITEPIFDGGVEGIVGGGERGSGVMKAGTKRTTQSLDYGKMPDVANLTDTYGDTGGVSRMFKIGEGRRCDWCGASLVAPNSPSDSRASAESSALKSAQTSEDSTSDASDATTSFALDETDIALRHAQTQLDGTAVSTAHGTLFPSQNDNEPSTTERSPSTAPEHKPTYPSPLRQPVKRAEEPRISTGTTTTTGSPSLCGRCAGLTISQFIQQREMQYESDSAGSGSHILIVPKAARSEKEPNWHGIEDEFSGVEAGHSVGPMAGRGEPGLKCRKCNRWKVSGNPCRCSEPDFEPQPFKRPKVFTDHPTVKPLDLMCHLVRLVCPPGGITLDPFLGSGTTAKACEMEGRQWIGIEKDPHFARIARARLSGTQKGFGL